MELSLALAFAAGVLSFLTPCVLALVPVYLAFLAEAAASTPLPADGPSATPVRAHPAFLQALLFIGGFGMVFVLLGLVAGVVGTALFREPLVRQVTGVIIIGLGFLMTGALGPVLDRVPSLAPSVAVPRGRVTRAVGLGALVAVGWTPCIGPVLGAILAMGASSQDVAAAAALLVAYTLGLGVPFLAVAVALPRATPVLHWLRARERGIRVVAGIMVMVIGVLVFADAFTRISSLFGEFFF